MSDKFVETGEGIVVSQCAYCRHLGKDPQFTVCAAFPGQIPAEILSNDFDHRRPWIDPQTQRPGDKGIALTHSILFDPRPDVPPAVLARLDQHFRSQS